MPRKFRRWNIILVFMLFIQAAIYPANALGNDSKAKITAEQASQKVKNYFTIPEAYKQLNTGFNDYNNRESYSLNWNAPDQPSGSFSAEVDAVTGDILRVNQWGGPLQSSFKFSLPVLSEAEAKKIAADLISKLAGQHQAEMQLVKDQQQPLAMSGSQPFTFNFRWVRIVNGIQFPENGVNVSVSGEDGQIINYSYNWTDNLVFPEAVNVIAPEKARQVFAETPMLQLQYYLTPIRNPQDQEPQRVLLVYQADNKYSGGQIDALSGKPVTPDLKAGLYRLSTTTISAAQAGVSAEGQNTAAVSSTSADTQGQISRDEAVNAVKKAVEIPGDFVLRNSNLDQDWQNPGNQVWDLYWSTDSAMMGGEQRSLNASVSAKTGDVVSVNTSGVLNPADKSAPLDREGARKLAEDFLKRVQPERFKLFQINANSSYIGDIPANIQTFNYDRFANGLVVSNNGVYITVDTETKQIINYSLNWSNVDFPSLTGVLPLDQATELFLKERPLSLNYVLNSRKDGQQDVRLVYQPDTSNYSPYAAAMLNAQTGEPLDWYGESQSQWPKANEFTDIQGNYAEKEISIIALTGAFGEYGETFHPDEKVSVNTLLRAMIMADGNNRDRVLKDNDVLKIAKEQGWLPTDLDLKAELTRADLAKIMIRLINMEPAAKVKGIYAVPFKDAAAIEPDSLGYIALAWGLGILKVDDNTLNPSQTVTRAEAAYALVHAYEVMHPQS